MKHLFWLLAVLGILAGYWYYRNLTTGPEYALLQAKEAAEKHDLAAFEKYVAVENLTENLVDQLLTAGENLNLGIPGLQLAPGMLDFLKPQLVENATREVRRFITTGRVNANPNGPFLSLAAIAGVFFSKGSDFREIAYVRKDGNTALVGLAFSQSRYDTTLVIEVKMLEKGDYWQATELTNVTPLLQSALRLEEKRRHRIR